MSSHTPGPWKAGSKTVTAPETEDRLPLDIRIFGWNADDNRANARLIAAAPELLEALEDMLDLITEGLVRMNGAKLYPAGQRRVDGARAIVAKATGR